MSSLCDSCLHFFGTDNLYGVLSISADCTAYEVKQGYRKRSLEVHPDRVPEKDKTEATEKFKILGKVYSILSDKDQRAVYDETGEIDEAGSNTSETRDWMAYWRLLFAKFTTADIADFETKYHGSDQELEDLKQAYIDAEGDIFRILDTVLCCNDDDEARFREVLSPLIESGELPTFQKFSRDDKKRRAARRKKAEIEKSEAKAAINELNKEDNSLEKMIQLRQQTRQNQMNDFFSNLEAKYAAPKKGGVKKGKQSGSNDDTSSSKKRKTKKK